MPRHVATFTQNDITRAVKGATAGGFKTAQVEIGPDGKIVLIADTGERASVKRGGENEWDELP